MIGLLARAAARVAPAGRQELLAKTLMAILKDSHLLERKDELFGQLNCCRRWRGGATTTWRGSRTGVKGAGEGPKAGSRPEE